MFGQANLRGSQRTRLVWWLCAVLAVVGSVAMGNLSAVAAEDDAAMQKLVAESSLKWIPADAAFYTSSRLLREQYDRVANSKAIAKLLDLPAVRNAIQQARAEWEKEGSSLAPLRAMADTPAGKMYAEFAADVVSNEIFCYGDAQWPKTLEMFVALMNTIRYQDALRTAGVELPPTEELVLAMLKDDLDAVRVPVLVFGFKLKDPQRGQEVLSQVEFWLSLAMSQAPEELKGSLKRVKISGSSFLTLRLDGSMIPWDEADIPEHLLEKYDDVFQRLREATLAVTMGVLDDYLLLSIGDSNRHLAQFGKGDLLADRDEFKPLRKFAAEPICAVAYGSKELAVAAATGEDDLDGLVELAEEMLAVSDVPEDLQKRFLEDARRLADDLKEFLPEPGATMQFSFMVPDGYQTYTYNWTENLLWDSSKPLTILNHVGGAPILAAAFRAQYAPQHFDKAVQWVKAGFTYFEELAVPRMADNDRRQYERFAPVVIPALGRLTEITRQKLIPAFADGQSAFVLDARWRSRQCHAVLPAADDELPLPEIGIIYGVSDPQLLRDAYNDLRVLAIDTWTKLHELEPDRVPPVHVPELHSAQLESGKIYFRELPAEWGLDKQVLPNVGLSDRVMVVSASREHSQRLLAEVPLQTKGPLADPSRPLAWSVYFNWPALVDAAAPWIRYALQGNNVPDDVWPQVETALEVLKSWRELSVCTYAEDGAMVTHSVNVFHDVP